MRCAHGFEISMSLCPECNMKPSDDRFATKLRKCKRCGRRVPIETYKVSNSRCVGDCAEVISNRGRRPRLAAEE